MKNRTKILAENAALLLCALALSYLESLLPLSLIVTIPGFKLGLANLAVAVALWRLGACSAISVSFLKILISSLLFGTASTFMFSLSGGALSLLALVGCYFLFGDKMSMVAVSILSAVFHNIGQIFCAAAVTGTKAVFSYSPILIICGVICGTVTGAVLTSFPKQIYRQRSFK